MKISRYFNIIPMFAIVALLFIAKTGIAQNDIVELIRADLKTEKRAIVTLNMELTEEHSKVFWPIYDEYELELKKISDKKWNLLQNFGENYGNFSDEMISETVTEHYRIEKEIIDLRNKYYKIFAKAITPTKAGRFIQIENKLGLLIDIQISEAVPLIY